MIKRVVTAGITMAFSVSVLITPLCAEAAITPGKTYRDTTGHWSLQVVEKASAIELMSGYPGGSFQPEKMMSRLEAISVIIRAMGLEDQALKTKAQGSGITMPKGMTWGEGYLVLAVQKGLLSKEYVPALKYNEAITRAEVATLVAVALNIKGDTSKLTYADSSSILELYKPYVSAVTEKNIMGGLGNNQFGPNQGMKRGQMAALLANLAQNGWFKYGADKLVTGSVVSFDATTGLLVLKKTDGTVLQKALADKPALFNGSIAATLADIKSGTNVVAAQTGTGLIQYLEIAGSAPAVSQVPDTTTVTTVTGKAKSSPGAAGTSITIAYGSSSGKSYSLATGLVVKDQSGTVTLSSVTSGKYITAKINNNQVTSITILPTTTVEGEIKSVSSTSLKISSSGSSYNYVLKSSETIVNGAVSSISGLKTGNDVKVISYQDQALEISVSSVSSSKDKMEGVVTKLDTGSSPEITVEDDDDDKETFDITDDTDFTRDGDDIDLDEIMIGAEVEIEYDDDEALEIKVTNDEDGITVEGEVTKVDEDNDRITIEQDSGETFKLDVDSKCTFKNKANSDDVDDLGDIDKGWYVEIELDDSEATKITVVDEDEDEDEIEGVVTKLDTGSSPEITVKDDDDKETFKITEDDTDITRNGKDISLKKIMIGAKVKVKYDDDEALEIEVTNDEDNITVEGEVTTSMDEDDDTITIKQNSGSKFTIKLDSSCSFKNDANSTKVKDLGDIKKGWNVEIELDNSEATKITVVD